MQMYSSPFASSLNELIDAIAFSAGASSAVAS
jgi:hypothetical protein